MKNIRRKAGLKLLFPGALILLLVAPVRTQTVIRVLNGYVLFDSAEGMGKSGGEVDVVRNTDGGSVLTGKVKLLLFRDGKASGKIVEGGSDSIRIGDMVRRPVWEEKKAADAALPSSNLARTVIRVVPGYALVEPDGESWEENAVLRVLRRSEQGMTEIGDLQVLRRENGKVGAKILREREPFRITAGDAVFAVESGADIDTYFYGGFGRD